MPDYITPMPIERETSILYNEKEKIASITTFDKSLIKRLNRICETNPEFRLVEVIPCSKVDEYIYEIPKKYVAVRTPKILSDEQKAELAVRLSRRE